MSAEALHQYVAALDVGTTTIRCFIYDRSVQIRGSATEQVELLYPEPHHVEIDPEQLWLSIVRCIQNAMRAARVSAAAIATLGISTQRSTFITWHRETGRPFHNFITWKDLRADALVQKWNASYILKTMHGVSRCLYMLTRKSRFLAGSVLKLMNTQTTLRLAWAIQHNKQLQESIAARTAMFGTLDSWLLYRLRRGNSGKPVEHIADVSSCAATGFYDPFTLGWAQWAFKLFSLHGEMMPRVVTNSHDFGSVHASVLGAEVRIGCTIGDQSASMWGSCCFKKGDVKITLGTGSFLDVNTGDECHASIHGMYPLVAWQTGKPSAVAGGKDAVETVYCVEGSASDTGSIIKWAMDFGLFKDPADSAAMAQSVPDTDGVYFVPAFSGLGAPLNDHQAGSGLIGLRPSTRNAHIVRAVLESIAFRVAQLYDCTLNETKFKFSVIRVDGGVSKNDFICQLLANLTGLHVERSVDSELSVLGAGFLAGLNTGFWTGRDELLRLRQIERTFVPADAQTREACVATQRGWERAVDRFRGWYGGTSSETTLLERSSASAALVAKR